jgi:DNA-binding transcriptional ArsR family regulator
MVKYKSEPLDSVFSALADPTRRAILARLATGHSSVGDLAEPFDISLPAVSRHLRVLRNAGLITRHKDGRVRLCTLEAAPLQAASDWIETYRQFWEGQFDSLAEYLERTQDGTKQNPDDQTQEPLKEDE